MTSATGPGKISLALGNAKRPAPANGIKRSHAALRDQDDEDDEGPEHGKAQRVSHFDHTAGGAIDDQAPKVDKTPLVIASQANRDWKEASQRNRRQKSGLPKNASRNGGRENEILAVEAAQKGPEAGLNLPSARRDELDAGDVDPETGSAKTAAAEANAEGTGREKTEDERAMDALLGRDQQSTLVLPALTEEEAFERDYRSAPDMATLDDYARVPVEQFGAALLRGLGWKDGEGIGSDRGKTVVKTKLPQRRAALLGIGAKEEAAVAQELGSWGRAAKDRKGPPVIYNPVLLRDKKTGELFTEAELQQRKEKEEGEKFELEFEELERRREEKRRRRDTSRERASGGTMVDRRREKSRERDDGSSSRKGRRYDSRHRMKESRADQERSRRHDRSDRDRIHSRRDVRDHEDGDEEYYERRREKDRRQRRRDDGDERDEHDRIEDHDSDCRKRREKERDSRFNRNAERSHRRDHADRRDPDRDRRNEKHSYRR